MFAFLRRNPLNKLRRQHAQLQEKAMLAQRSGDIKTYSMITAEAHALWLRIEAREADTRK